MWRVRTLSVVATIAGLALAGCSKGDSTATKAEPSLAESISSSADSFLNQPSGVPEPTGMKSPNTHETPKAPARNEDGASVGTHDVGSVPQGAPSSNTQPGPVSAPAGYKTVKPGDTSYLKNNVPTASKIFFAPGKHAIPGGEFGQITPREGDAFIGAPGAILDGAGVNKYAFTGKAKNVTIKHLTVQNFKGAEQEGVINHDSGENWTIAHNVVQNNGGAGVFIGSGNKVTNNKLLNNGQYGFSMYNATAGALKDIVIDRNEIAGNNTDDLEKKRPGCGCTGGGKLWDAHNVTITNNYVHDNKSVGIWADTNNYNFTISGNYIANNYAEGIFYETSYNATIKFNHFKNNGLGKANDEKFPIPAVYISESGGDPRVAGVPKIDISNNIFEGNRNGVVLWENSDRFCASPNNTSTGYCTLVGGATIQNCGSGSINSSEKHKYDCRWRTQNVLVSNNTFTLGNLADCSAMCGQVSTVSNFGTSPDWSPFKGDIIPNAIVKTQNNTWVNNTYNGPWKFEMGKLNSIVSRSAWQGAGFDVGGRF